MENKYLLKIAMKSYDRYVYDEHRKEDKRVLDRLGPSRVEKDVAKRQGTKPMDHGLNGSLGSTTRIAGRMFAEGIPAAAAGALISKKLSLSRLAGVTKGERSLVKAYRGGAPLFYDRDNVPRIKALTNRSSVAAGVGGLGGWIAGGFHGGNASLNNQLDEIYKRHGVKKPKK